MGSFLTRALIMALGYAYPAYECFKTVEKNKPDVQMLRFWCQYWILVAAITIFERVGDAFISWLPMYSEGKLAFFIYLWYPKTRGTMYVYDSFLRPYIAKHENDIDRNLLELRSRAGDVALLYWQKTVTYGQTRFFEILQYVASQSQPPRPSTSPRQPPPSQGHQQPPPPIVSARQPVAQQQQPQPQPRTQQQPPHAPPAAKNPVKDAKQEAEKASSQEESPSPSQATSDSSPAEAAGPSRTIEVEPMQVNTTTAVKIEDQNSSPAMESEIEEAIRVTRARLRKTRAALAPAAPAR